MAKRSFLVCISFILTLQSSMVGSADESFRASMHHLQMSCRGVSVATFAMPDFCECSHRGCQTVALPGDKCDKPTQGNYASGWLESGTQPFGYPIIIQVELCQFPLYHRRKQ
ncbi:hypothetical protein AUEXF2481DRAFT_34592 [Aureobasidium subglaciale EXF-2481]|uniref:Uncharacterized protein n=1 Tax=Aureobasidium subglaciale (strain EXF-2481) TaxID=1043005 RepID=A0A074YRT3_AURSE|nr:uncharacterized protein AUEXF2481DRAFT_34592 [Aureobasidium subglaciale EXF-2481]KER00391.1 hypothetical protein AUEXF2481DRAFT_34592 [Aureobasidium subglaciale EXF-2481]